MPDTSEARRVTGIEQLLTWQSVAGIAAVAGLMLPVVIYGDWRKKGRTLTESAYWHAWWTLGGALLAMFLAARLWHYNGIAGLAAIVGGYALGMAVTFWYALLLERCLRILGALVPAQ